MSNPTAAQIQLDAVTQRKAANRTEHVGGKRDPMLARSPDIARMVSYWSKSDAVLDGIEAMREGREEFLPRFPSEEAPEYEGRLSLTKMTNIYSDVLESLAAKPFEEEVTLLKDDDKEVPREIEEFTYDVDGAGNNLTVFAGETFLHGINSGIDWIFVDEPKTDGTILTVADAKAANISPYWSRVRGPNVLQVKTNAFGKKQMLTYIRIYEPGSPDHVRIIERDDTGMVNWTLYRHDASAKPGMFNGEETQFIQVDAGTFGIDEIPLVPFRTGRRVGMTWEIKPPMKAAVELQIELYQQESDLKYAKKATAFPMLTGNGVSPALNPDGSVKKIATGPMRVLYAPPNGNGDSGSWAYIEPSSESLKFLAAENMETIRQLRELGRQPLTTNSGNLTTVTTSVAAGKAKSAIKQWAVMLKDALENAMRLTAKFKGIPLTTYDPTINVFIEFDDFLEGKDLESLDKARDRKDISQQTYHDELKRRGVLNRDFSHDKEVDRLAKELPGDGPDMRDMPPPA